MSNKIDAIIFDLDGVITDTAEYHFKAWRYLAEELGISIDRQFNEQLKGVTRLESLNKVLEYGNLTANYSENEKIRLAELKNDHYQKLISNISPKDILPGILPLLEEIKSNNIPIGLGSASRNASFIIEKLKLKNYFDYIVDASEVERGKPDPETFLNAVNHFEVNCENCIGIEDAEAGVTAIKAASMFAVGVGSKDILKNADYIVSSTDELSFVKMVDKFNSR